MRPVFHDYEYFQSAFYDILAGIKELIKQKLWYLSKRRWRFKGWITYPDYHDIRFELTYDDEKTEESYRISGHCDILMKFVIKEATFEFDVLDEHSQKFVNFKTDFDDKESLKDIEQALNELLKNNRSYRYFCEDYERYIKQNPIQYIRDLLSDHLIDIEEEIIEEGSLHLKNIRILLNQDSIHGLINLCLEVMDILLMHKIIYRIMRDIEYYRL